MNIVEIIISVGMASYLIYGIYVLYLTKKDYSKVNLNDLDLIPSMFTTIGILGTFGGIAYGLWFFNDKDISNSIPLLLKGLKTASKLGVEVIGTPQDYTNLNIPTTQAVVGRLISFGVRCTWTEDEMKSLATKISECAVKAMKPVNA